MVTMQVQIEAYPFNGNGRPNMPLGEQAVTDTGLLEETRRVRAHALFHPDCNRRLRHRTGSADPSGRPEGARGLRARPDTAGGEFHPALRTVLM